MGRDGKILRVHRQDVEFKCSNDWGGEGYGDSVPVEVTKTSPSGDRTT